MTARFDLKLFTELNEEYRERPLVPKPRQFDEAARRAEAERRTARLDRVLDLRGKRVLEVGCGAGGVGRQLAEQLDCSVVGIDISSYPAWTDDPTERVSFVVGDISDPPPGIGRFDAIFSFSVWEHLMHPHAALARSFDLLEPGGRMFLQAQLYRGPKASHRYREVFFPWPHLLFTPDVFEDYYRSIGRKPMRPAWVNKLTYGQYVDYIDRVGFHTVSRRAIGTADFDEALYARFHDELSAYPRWDLSHDVISTVVDRPSADGSPGQRTRPRARSVAWKAWNAVPESVRTHPQTRRLVGAAKRLWA
jgi:SAM-dependent methyltransferase